MHSPALNKDKDPYKSPHTHTHTHTQKKLANIILDAPLPWALLCDVPYGVQKTLSDFVIKGENVCSTAY